MTILETVYAQGWPLLAVLLVGGGYFAWQSSMQQEDTGPLVGFTCMTDAGDCPLSVSQTLGSSCTCVDEFGTAWTGIVG